MLTDPSYRTQLIVSAVAVVIGIVAIVAGTPLLGLLLILIAIAFVGMTLSGRRARRTDPEDL